MVTDLEWKLADAIYHGRIMEAWGDRWTTRPKFPATAKDRRAYFHGHEIADVDLALASAREVIRRGNDIFSISSTEFNDAP